MPHTGGRLCDRNREEDIRQAMIQSTRKSLGRLSAEENVPYTTCQRIVQRYLNMFPYHMFLFVTSLMDHCITQHSV
jgi:hypothetical protein